MLNFTQENDLWLNLQQQSNSQLQQQQLLELIKLLLAKVDNNETTLAQFDKEILLDCLLEQQKIAEFIVTLLTTTLPHLAEEYQGGNFEQTLQTLKQEVAQQLAKAKQLAAKIKLINTEKNRFAQITQKYQHLAQQFTEEQQQLQNFKQQYQQLKQLSQQLKETQLAKLTVVDKLIDDSLIMIASLIHTLQQRFSNQQQHYQANQTVTEALQQEGFAQTYQYTEELITLSQTIQGHLSSFDARLNEWLAHNEKQQALLRNLREPQQTLSHAAPDTPEIEE